MRIILHGKTRVVFLTKTRAVKVARISVWWVIRRFVRTCREGDFGERLEAYHQNPWKAIIRYLFQGVIANRREFREWRRVQEYTPCAPTTRSFFLGFVIVQIRGMEVTAEELRREHPFRHLLIRGEVPKGLMIDLTNPLNFCRIDSQVCLLDYGSDPAARFFRVD